MPRFKLLGLFHITLSLLEVVNCVYLMIHHLWCNAFSYTWTFVSTHVCVPAWARTHTCARARACSYLYHLRLLKMVLRNTAKTKKCTKFITTFCLVAVTNALLELADSFWQMACILLWLQLLLGLKTWQKED